MSGIVSWRRARRARFAAPGLGFLGAFHGHGCGQFSWAFALSLVIGTAGTVSWGGRKGGLGENLEPGDRGARGGPGFPPVRLRIDPPSSLVLAEQSRSVPDLALGSPRGGGEVGNAEAARSERVGAGRRGDRDGNATHSARARGRCAVRPVCGRCAEVVRVPRRPGRCCQFMSPLPVGLVPDSGSRGVSACRRLCAMGR